MDSRDTSVQSRKKQLRECFAGGFTDARCRSACDPDGDQGMQDAYMAGWYHFVDLVKEATNRIENAMEDGEFFPYAEGADEPCHGCGVMLDDCKRTTQWCGN